MKTFKAQCDWNMSIKQLMETCALCGADLGDHHGKHAADIRRYFRCP